MGIIKLAGLVLFSVMLLSYLLPAQEIVDRKPYAAGRFYEDDAAKLTADLSLIFGRTIENQTRNVLAIISPHAGFVYSGEVAASAFKQLDPSKEYKNIFLIGSSHTMRINGASVYSAGDYITPFGKVTVNKQLAQKLISKNNYISFIPEAHAQEHILETQLPFMQYYLEKPFQIVPMVIGTDDKKVLSSLAETLEPFLNEDNLFVISADFSHYPDYRDAQKADSLTAKAILANNAETFSKALKKNEKAGMSGLVTSTCGSTAILTLLNITQTQDDLQYMPIEYMNSGDAPIGDKNRVVGYFSIALVRNQVTDSFDFLTEKDMEDLLVVARQTVEEYINNKKVLDFDPSQFSENLMTKSGAFVTLNKNHNLRGCVGRFTSDKALYLVVQDMAIAAATQDYRFQMVKSEELPFIEVEVSVLTPLKKIGSNDEIMMGRDGIYIIKGDRSGTFLPQVAEQTGWTKEEFLGHCARDKAGIGWDGWKEAEIYTYQAIVFSEGE